MYAVDPSSIDIFWKRKTLISSCDLWRCCPCLYSSPDGSCGTGRSILLTWYQEARCFFPPIEAKHARYFLWSGTVSKS